jgi:hypothetical protein
MKAGLDTRISNFVAVVLESGPFTLAPGAVGLVSENSPKPSPMMFRKTVEIAAEVMQCAHGYSGCIGVSPKVTMILPAAWPGYVLL